LAWRVQTNPLKRKQPFQAISHQAAEINEEGIPAMFKRIVMTALLGFAGSMIVSERSEAAIWYRPVAPVRRVAARAVLPPYPVARRVVAAPVVVPYGGYAPFGTVVTPVYGYGGPVLYGSPYVYGGGISVGFGY
jgi:hypothetical protein